MADLADFIRKTWLFGIGAISLTTEKVQELVDDLVERGEITREQGVSMVRELMKRGTEARKQFRDTVKAEVKKAINEADIATKADIARIESKIDRLILAEGQAHTEGQPPIEGEGLGASSEML